MSCLSAFAASSASVKIEKARELVLRGDRSSAIKILKELHREGSKEAASAWGEITEVFLTDKGQNQYSLAESIWILRPKDAVDVLQPLMKAEDGNLAVSRLGARAALRALDCVKAEPFVAQAEAAYPLGPDVKVLRLQLQDCLNGTAAGAPALKIPTELAWGELDSAIKMLTVKDALRKKDLRTARAVLATWETTATEDPEFWYLKWRASPEASRDRLAARKYLRLCADLSPRKRKSFAMYPELCLHTETIESDLKSSEKSGT